MKKLSDFAVDDTQLEGEKVSIENVEGKDIAILKCRFANTKFKGSGADEYCTIQFKYIDDESLHVIFTSSRVVIDQIKRYSDQLPFQCKIVKINRYYALK